MSLEPSAHSHFSVSCPSRIGKGVRLFVVPYTSMSKNAQFTLCWWRRIWLKETPRQQPLESIHSSFYAASPWEESEALGSPTLWSYFETWLFQL
jgi:hypothetical protein